MMDSDKVRYFQLLKEEVEKTFNERQGVQKNLEQWSVNDIRDFQDDLLRKSKGSVSEKWVYLHFKKSGKTLPRIDVLNLLSEYCGYKSWEEFYGQRVVRAKSTGIKKIILLITVLVLLIIGLFWALGSSSKTIQITFSDAYTNSRIPTNSLMIKVRNEKSIRLQPDEKQVVLKVNNSDTLVVDGNYYKPVSIYVDKEMKAEEINISLYPDDYALMLNYFSRTTIKDWETRQNQLNSVIHEDAVIFQVHQKYDGIEMLNKKEFIDRLILPINSLKNLEIIHVEYKDTQIYRLRFVQNLDQNETN